MNGKKLLAICVSTILVSGLAACGNSGTGGALNGESKPATELTAQTNQEVYALLDFDDRQEMEFAERGLIAAPEQLEITDESGKVVWSQKAYAFLDQADQAPDTANPSLWRNAQLNHLYGLFEVTDGIYQVRGYDMSNITFVESDGGWIVFDPLMSVECAKAAKELVDENLGQREIKAVIISHSHIDHYGGIKGIVDEADVRSGKVQVLVPAGFVEEAISENVYAGKAMGRRAGYQYGTLLERSAEGSLCIGIGMGQSTGTTSYITPTREITERFETITIDGVEMEFQLTPGTEAPAEMNTFFPQKRALWMAENCTGTLHNLYTLRGAQVRDGNAWAHYLMESLARYGTETDVVFQAHNWPHFGNEVIKEYVENTAAAYKYINDQTLLYLNQGDTSTEVAQRIKLPDSLEKVWYTRQYYGTVAHNAKAVYQKYMGWYDANPVNLNRLTPSEEAVKFVEYLGDPDKVLEKAKADFEKGEYQWVAQITNLLVYADPKNQDARYLCADALEQLGYQAESGTWRNCYLSAAYELRNGTESSLEKTATSTNDQIKSAEADLMLNYLGIVIDGSKLSGSDCTVNFVLSDTGQQYVVRLLHGSLLYHEGSDPDAEATYTMPKMSIFALAANQEQGIEQIRVEGSSEFLDLIRQNIAEFPPYFNIIEP